MYEEGYAAFCQCTLDTCSYWWSVMD